MNKPDSLRKTVRLGDKTFFVDLESWSKGGKATIEVVEPDGSRRKATPADGNLWEILSSGHVVAKKTMMKVPRGKYPYTANLQRNDPEKYEHGFIDFKKIINKPRFKESDYWEVSESALWDILYSSDIYRQNEKKKKEEEKKKKARIEDSNRRSKAFVDGLNRGVLMEMGKPSGLYDWKENIYKIDLDAPAESRVLIMEGNSFIPKPKLSELCATILSGGKLISAEKNK